MKHHAIICTSFKLAHLSKAHLAASEIGLTVTDIHRSPHEEWYTFLVVPDGSKEGWPRSDEGEQLREAFIQWLRDNNLYIGWVQVGYGGDDEEVVDVVSGTYEERS